MNNLKIRKSSEIVREETSYSFPSILIGIARRIRVQCLCFPTSLLLLLQEYARKALDFIWEKRQRSSNLVGVTINIHTGDWVRKGGADTQPGDLTHPSTLTWAAESY